MRTSSNQITRLGSVYETGKWHFGDCFLARYRVTAIEINDDDNNNLQYRYRFKININSDEGYVEQGDIEELELTEV
jgi:hypothetical protein